jgi:hypothetical protein
MKELGIRVALGAQRKEVLKANGTSHQVASVWFRGRIVARNPGEARVGFHRVSGNSARPSGLGRDKSWRGRCWACSHLDSSTTRPVDRSYDTAARGVNRRGTGGNRLFDSQDEAASLHLMV